MAKRAIDPSDFDDDVASGYAWGPWAGNHTLDGNNVVVTNTADTDQNSATKTIALNQNVANAVRLSADSMATNVTMPGIQAVYALRARVTYVDATTEDFYSHFRGGTHDWETVTLEVRPSKPIATLNPIVMLYNSTGTATFGNLVVQELGAGDYGVIDDEIMHNTTRGGGFMVKDFGVDEHWYTLATACSNHDFGLVDEVSSVNSATTHTTTVTNTNGAGRAATLAYRIPVSDADLKWLEADYRTETPITQRFTEHRNELSASRLASIGDFRQKSLFLWGAVANATTGYGIGVDPESPAQFRIRHNQGTGELIVLFDLGFATDVDKATVKFVTWTFDPTWGMRQVARDFYDQFPDNFSDRIVEAGKEHGLWFIHDISSGNIANPEDFGFKFNQNGTSSDSMTYDEANGIDDLLYVNSTESFIDISDLGQHPTYAEVVDKVNTLAANNNEEALTVVSCGVRDVDGNYVYHLGSEWAPDYARFMVNSSPNLTNHNGYDEHWSNGGKEHYLYSGTMDGVMHDNAEYFYWVACDEKTRINYASNQFAGMQTPLVFDAHGHVGISYEMMLYEFFSGMRSELVAEEDLKIVLANGAPYTTTFVTPQLDLVGGEQTWDSGGNWNPIDLTKLLHFRAQAGRKPVVFLQNPSDLNAWGMDETEKYFSRSAAYGVMPSFFIGDSGNSTGQKYFADNPTDYYERDRPLFQTYIPVIKRLSEAGWQPVTNATLSDSSLTVERFGEITAAGSVYFTVFNPTATIKTTTLTFDSGVNVGTTTSITELITDTAVTVTGSTISVTLATESVAVLELRYN